MWDVVEGRVYPERSGIRTFCTLKVALLCRGGTSRIPASNFAPLGASNSHYGPGHPPPGEGT